MFDLFLEFLSYITTNLKEYLSSSEEETTYRDVLSAYVLVALLTGYLERFAGVLGVWQRDSFHGRAWGGAQVLMVNIDHTFALLGDGLKASIVLRHPHEEHDLRCKFRGGPSLTKFDVFDIWEKIIDLNAVDNFCGWVSDHSGKQVKRTIYIPNYSLLLPAPQRTSQVGNPRTSQYWGRIDFDWLDTVGSSELNHRALTFLPELPPEFPIESQEFNRLTRATYAKVIETPADEGEMTQIIQNIQQAVATFRPVVDSLRNELVTQGQKQPEKLLNAL